MPGTTIRYTRPIRTISWTLLYTVCSSANKYKTYAFDGVRINRFNTLLPITKPIKRGAYMGSHFDGVYK
ncbi:hypothetical protein [Spirosoma aerophilum]